METGYSELVKASCGHGYSMTGKEGDLCADCYYAIGIGEAIEAGVEEAVIKDIDENIR